MKYLISAVIVMVTSMVVFFVLIGYALWELPRYVGWFIIEFWKEISCFGLLFLLWRLSDIGLI